MSGDKQPVKRFVLTASDSVDRLIAVFISAASRNYNEAKLAFKSLTWTPQEIATWSDEKRTMAHYFANRLAQYHLASNQEIMEALNGANHTAPKAQAWYEAIVRNLNYGCNSDITVPWGCDGYHYLKALLGLTAVVPTDHDSNWDEVPF